MRALTVRQPWAWAIIHGGKDVENRARSLGPYRGPVAIHAGLTVDRDGYANTDVLVALLVDGCGRPPSPLEARMGRGAILGVADLVAAHLECEGYCGPWAQVDAWHLVLRNPRPLAHPIPWRGALGLWTVPADLEAAIRAQLGNALPAEEVVSRG